MARSFHEIINDIVHRKGDSAELRRELRTALEGPQADKEDPDTIDVARLVLCALEDTESEAPDEDE